MPAKLTWVDFIHKYRDLTPAERRSDKKLLRELEVLRELSGGENSLRIRYGYLEYLRLCRDGYSLYEQTRRGVGSAGDLKTWPIVEVYRLQVALEKQFPKGPITIPKPRTPQEKKMLDTLQDRAERDELEINFDEFFPTEEPSEVKNEAKVSVDTTASPEPDAGQLIWDGTVFRNGNHSFRLNRTEMLIGKELWKARQDGVGWKDKETLLKVTNTSYDKLNRAFSSPDGKKFYRAFVEHDSRGHYRLR